MMKPFIFIVILLLPIFALAETMTREYFYFNTYMTWKDAQSFCREHYRDLATITNEEENQRAVVSRYNFVFYTWIGLYREKLAPDVWQWSDEEPASFRMWNIGSTSWFSINYYNCTTIYVDSWTSNNCEFALSFFCYRFLILVQEKKTWEEAQQYCRAHYTDLAHLTSQTQLRHLKKAVETSETEGVWMGMHYYDGQWLWTTNEQYNTLNGQRLCPPRPFHCGVYKTTTNTLENRDCNKKLNFLCYWD